MLKYSVKDLKKSKKIDNDTFKVGNIHLLIVYWKPKK